MGKFGKQRDTEYVISLKNGEVLVLRACKVIYIEAENVLWFHSNSFNINPVMVHVEDISTIENNGKIVSIGAWIAGLVGGGMAGGVICVLLKGVIAANFKNPIANKVFLGLAIAGTAYVVGCAVGNALADQSMDFVDSTKYVVNKVKDGVNNTIDEIKNKKKEGDNE